MDNTKPIYIEFSKGAILTDVSSNLAALARTIEISAESGKAEAGDANAIRTLAGYINSPSDNVIRPVVARAFTEAYDRIKTVCQRYLILGRTEDDNRLESIINGEVITVFHGAHSSHTESTLGRFTPEAGKIYKITSTSPQSGGCSVSFEYNGSVESLNTDQPKEIKGVADAGEAVFRGSGIASEFEIVADSSAYAVFQLELAMPGNFNIGMTSAIKSAANKVFVDYILSQVLRFQRPDDAAEMLKSVVVSEDSLRRALTARNTFTRSHHDWN